MDDLTDASYSLDSNDDSPIEFIPCLSINIPYYLSDEGILYMGQLVRCSNCNLTGPAYVDMSCIKEDKLIHTRCPMCDELSLEVITYKVNNIEEIE